MVTGLDSGMRDKQVMRLFTGWRPVAAEVILNGNGKARPLAIVEFQAERYLTNAVESYTNSDYPKIKVRPVGLMSFPGVIGDPCSLKSNKPVLLVFLVSLL